ncbi:hypothetical protein RvY_13634 [Ramazzottius varieornatus]|uniref:TauD/TfdA-like domain-containing protein n=1 Tax=Ramazzottius varieornatus TaxID=947166 RepID=A0A1D1VNJ7_RAMVA|nr:hypothetical protein RvY_13634 [Ramazzottius varieornatus]
MDVNKLKEVYKQKGAVILRDFLSEEWIQRGINGVEQVFANPSKYAQTFPYVYGEGHYFRDYGNWKDNVDIRDLIFKSPIVKAIADIVDSRSVTLYHDQTIVKDPRNMLLVGFQQRMSNYPFAGSQGCTAYVTLDRVPLETALKVVIGSHLWGKTFYPDGFNPQCVSEEAKSDQYETVPNIFAMHDLGIMEWSLNPGDVILYDMRCVVSTNGNATEHLQRALGLHFFGEDAKFVERPWPINPPFTGNLKMGDHPSKDPSMFPIVYPDSSRESA